MKGDLTMNSVLVCEKYGLPDDMPDDMKMQYEGLPVMSEEDAIVAMLTNIKDDELSADDMPDDMREQLESFPVMSE